MEPFVHRHPSLPTFEQLEGKTIKQCRGFYEDGGDEHVSIEFTDGTQLTIAGNCSSPMHRLLDAELAQLKLDLIFRLK